MTKEDIIKEYKVDILKLKRDYIKDPLYKKDGFHLSEYPNKDDFVYLFLDCNIRRNLIVENQESKQMLILEKQFYYNTNMIT